MYIRTHGLLLILKQYMYPSWDVKPELNARGVCISMNRGQDPEFPWLIPVYKERYAVSKRSSSMSCVKGLGSRPGMWTKCAASAV